MKSYKLTCALLILAAWTQCPAPTNAAEISGEDMDQVILRLKQEVAIYQQAQSSWEADPTHDPAREGVVPQCGQGGIDFKLVKLKLDLITTINAKNNGTLSLKIPFASGLGTVGPGLSGSHEMADTQELVLYSYPSADTFAGVSVPTVIRKNSTIAATLIALRESLIRSSAQKPCLLLSIPDQHDDNTFSINFTVKKDVNPSLGFDLLVLSASAAYDRSKSVTHTITISFSPSGDISFAHPPH